MPKVRNEPKLTCATCSIRKCNWFTPCADCNYVLCTACFTDHVCTAALQAQEPPSTTAEEDAATSTKPKKKKLKKKQGKDGGECS